MPRPATGQVVVRDGAAGRTFALRFRAYGERRYQTLGTDAEGWDDRRAATELENVLADVRRGLWRPTSAAPVAPEVKAEPTFNEFALGWYERKAPELRDRSAEDYRWALNRHLLPHFANYRLSEITVEVVDRYRAAKVREREDRLSTGPCRTRRSTRRSCASPRSWKKPSSMGTSRGILRGAGGAVSSRTRRRGRGSSPTRSNRCWPSVAAIVRWSRH